MNENETFERPWWLLPVGRIDARWWVPVGVAMVTADFFIGPDSQFPVLYFVPVSLAAWYSGRRPAVALALAVPFFHLVHMLLAMQGTMNTILLATMTVARGAVILVMALWFARLSEHERQLLRYVVRLEGLLRICSVCKSIRNERGVWEPLEAFITDRSEADFTHGLCPRCVARESR